MSSEEDFGMRLTIVEDRVNALEDEILHNSKIIKESLVRISDAVRTESTEREISDDRKAKELKLTESMLALDINLERANRKESEMRILKEIDERCIRISMEMDTASSSKGRATNPQEYSRLRQDFESEKKRRQEVEEGIFAKIDSEAKLLHDLISTEKKLREESTKNLTGLLENFRARFSEELLKEQRSRQASEKTTLHLIEDIGKKFGAR